MKSLLDSGLLTKYEFENKITKIKVVVFDKYINFNVNDFNVIFIEDLNNYKIGMFSLFKLTWKDGTIQRFNIKESNNAYFIFDNKIPIYFSNNFECLNYLYPIIATVIIKPLQS